jgi:hypothetical protein
MRGEPHHLAGQKLERLAGPSLRRFGAGGSDQQGLLWPQQGLLWPRELAGHTGPGLLVERLVEIAFHGSGA